MFWKGVLKELLWFIKGSTNAKELQDEGVRIWDGNSSREFLDKQGLHHLEEGDLGPVYGFNWRYWNADYKDCKTDYTDQGVDQLKNVIDLLKNDPTSRRIIMTSWNPSTLNQIALPACHTLCQFYVVKNRLSCHLFQRSNDEFLGKPFNIASYALLTYMLAHICNLEPDTLVISGTDCHIYKTHVQQVREQLKRKPYPFPKLEINRKITNIDEFRCEDFELKDYKCHPTITARMAI